MTEAEVLTLCAFEEANLEPDDGLAAVVRVILNRMDRRYKSDGTVSGTVFWHNQFSWAEWEMTNGRYARVARTPAQVQERAARLLVRDEHYKSRWDRAAIITGKVVAGLYAGPAYAKLTDDTLLYDNLALAQPDWATPDKLVCNIGHHSFFRA